MILEKLPKKIPIGKAKDLTNQRFNKLTVLYRTENPMPKRHEAYWLCKCDCGNYTRVSGYDLTHNKIKSCGCWNKTRDRHYPKIKNNNFSGQIINNFKILKIDDSKPCINGKHRYWIVICPYCHKEFSISSTNIKTQFSCGCIKSKGEFLINTILLKNNYIFQTEYVFTDLPNRRFDFAIFDENNNLSSLIEWDGEQHFNSQSKYYTQEGILRDKEKNLYCLSHNIPLYRIPYFEYNNIKDVKDIFQNKFLLKGEK